MKTKLSSKFWVVLTLFSLMGQIAWVIENMYFNVFIYNMFSASASDIAVMVAASAISATLTTIFMGALSDRVGKRKIFICGGYILWGVSILSFTLVRLDLISKIVPLTVSAAAVGVLLTIILDCVMTFFGSTANDAAFNAWLTDSTDSTNRGAAEGINAMMPLVAILAVFGGFMAFDLKLASSWSVIFTIIGALTIFVGVIGCFIIKETPAAPSKNGYLQNILYGFSLSTVRKNKALYKNLFLFVIFNIAIQIFMPYLIIYYEKSLGMADYVFIMAPAIIIASVVTAFWGRFYDKKGFLVSSYISVAWLVAGFIILYLFKAKLPVFIGSLFMMCGYLSGMAVFGAVIRENTPKGKSGRLQGVRIFSQVLLPGVIGPFIGKTVLKNAETVQNSDGTVSFLPNQNIFLAALIVTVLLALLMFIFRERKKPRTQILTTPFEKETGEVPLSNYPRPLLERDSYICLNGKWKFRVERKGKETYSGEILVPFCPESKMSGVGKVFKRDSVYVYTRRFTLPENFKMDRVILNFGAVDQTAEVYINGSFVGRHTGGYLPFSFDITDYINKSDNIIRVEVADSLDIDLPYGKQTLSRGGMWYTAVSGIWQTVWLESVPKSYITEIKVYSSLNSVILKIKGGEEQKNIKIITPTGEKEYTFMGSSFELEIDNPVLWTPENPYIYRFTLQSGKDTVNSYFALRTVTVEKRGNKSFIMLNGKPYFFNGLLDQGYFSDGIFTPSTYEAYKNDILVAKKLGFNMLRKHIKIEPQLFYYYCDIYGIAVFQDCVNNGEYNFLRDTALPTIGIKHCKNPKVTDERKTYFEECAKVMIRALHTHPSVCYYTIFNEGWGQYDGARIYRELKLIDSSRIYDTASGWFYEQESDVVSEHIYFKPLKFKNISSDKPLVLSEFGGYSYKIPEHSFNLDKTYGYKKCVTAEAFERDLKDLYEKQVLPAIHSGLNATVLTQLSDVEDETNGILTYDRQVVKLGDNALLGVFKKIKAEFEKVSQ